MTKPRILVVTEKLVNFTLFSVKWVPSSSRLVVLGSHPRGTGVWQVYNMSKGELVLLNEVIWLILFPSSTLFIFS